MSTNKALRTPEPQRMQREPPKPTCASDEEAAAWAAKWWQDFQESSGTASEGALYHNASKLLALMEPASGDGLAPVKLVRGSWLLKRAKKLRAARTDEERAKLRVPRRQELEQEEPHALLTPAEVAAMPRGHAGYRCEKRNPCCCPEPAEERPLKLISISHAWLTPDHPDPLGEQLVNFADVVARERRCCRDGDEVKDFVRAACLCPCCPDFCTIGTFWGLPYFGQQCCAKATSFPRGEFMAFYDFASLHQKDPETGGRTGEEKTAFDSALDTMGTWYAHSLATTVALDVFPAGWDATTPYSELRHTLLSPYSLHSPRPCLPISLTGGDRGWPTFESAVSALVKESTPGSWAKFVRASEAKAQGRGGGVRPPPLHPEAFAAKLARKVFTNGSDLEMVAGIYARSLDGAFGGAEYLEFRDAGWGDEEAKAFAKVLPLARSARFLNLDRNNIGGDGYRALAEAIKAGGAPRLRKISPQVNSLTLSSWPTSDGGALKSACEARGIQLWFPTLSSLL